MDEVKCRLCKTELIHPRNIDGLHVLACSCGSTTIDDPSVMEARRDRLKATRNA